MRILFLSPRLCLPLVTGARIREYYMARALARHADVTYASFIQPGCPVPAESELSFFRDVRLVPLLGRYSLPKLARGLLGTQPLSVLNYTTPEMKSAVAEIGSKNRFDLVHVECCHMVEYVRMLARQWGQPVHAVYNWHNIESEVMERYAANVSSRLKKFYAHLTARRLARLEDWTLQTGLGHAVCSKREKEQLQAGAPGARLAVIENGVDTERFTPGTDAGMRRRLVLVGTMDYYANIEAAGWFTRRVWPAVRNRFPEWKLTLVGSNPTPAVLELRNEPNVEVTGTVPDVRPYYKEAIAAIVPLHTGGGTRLKILEGMAAGVPVVSTTLGAEGLAVSPGKDIDIVDDEAGWLPALTELGKQDRLWHERVAAGLALVRNSYDWGKLGDRLYEEYAGWLASTPS